MNQLKDGFNRSLEKAKSQALSLRNELDKMQSADEDLKLVEDWAVETETEVSHLFEAPLTSSHDWVDFESVVKVSIYILGYIFYFSQITRFKILPTGKSKKFPIMNIFVAIFVTFS